MTDLENVREVFRQFSPSSVIDVLLIAVVIFATLRLLSGTRAMTQLRGALTLIVMIVLIGRVFALTVVNFLVEHSLIPLLILGAIVFQPEIRRALDRLGRTGLQGWLTKPEYAEFVENVAVAARRMSRQHHGGLLVIERATGLQDVIETGVPIDARVTPELLTGIFFPNSPLHDMAVVLRDDRIVAASCVLPLANELPESDRQLGTRHRAALGITESTDAVAIVVSEETGNISVARDGSLHQVASPQALKEYLLSIPPVPNGRTAGDSE
jgi:diadenylate cyclase